MHADAYSGFKRLYSASRKPGPITEVACWSHVRHNFFDLARLAKAPIAIEAVKRIDELFAVEREINGLPSQERVRVRHERWRFGCAIKREALRTEQPHKAIAYCLARRLALTRFLDNGRLCISKNAAEREIRPIAVERHDWTLAASDKGGRREPALQRAISPASRRAHLTEEVSFYLFRSHDRTSTIGA